MNRTMTQATVVTAGAAVSLAWALLMAGCHTVEGAGRDVSALGRGVSGGAETVRHDVFGPEPDPWIDDDRYYYEERHYYYSDDDLRYR